MRPDFTKRVRDFYIQLEKIFTTIRFKILREFFPKFFKNWELMMINVLTCN